jgi:hypothetical protein
MSVQYMHVWTEQLDGFDPYPIFKSVRVSGRSLMNIINILT